MLPRPPAVRSPSSLRADAIHPAFTVLSCPRPPRPPLSLRKNRNRKGATGKYPSTGNPRTGRTGRTASVFASQFSSLACPLQRWTGGRFDPISLEETI